jgi:hypothetical protein
MNNIIKNNCSKTFILDLKKIPFYLCPLADIKYEMEFQTLFIMYIIIMFYKKIIAQNSGNYRLILNECKLCL